MLSWVSSAWQLFGRPHCRGSQCVELGQKWQLFGRPHCRRSQCVELGQQWQLFGRRHFRGSQCVVFGQKWQLFGRPHCHGSQGTYLLGLLWQLFRSFHCYKTYCVANGFVCSFHYCESHRAANEFLYNMFHYLKWFHRRAPSPQILYFGEPRVSMPCPPPESGASTVGQSTTELVEVVLPRPPLPQL